MALPEYLGSTGIGGHLVFLGTLSMFFSPHFLPPLWAAFLCTVLAPLRGLPPSPPCGKIEAEKGGEPMTKKDLEAKLDEALQAFLVDVKLLADDPYSREPVTKGELFDLHRQI